MQSTQYRKVGKFYFDQSQWLGRGAFGTVHLAYDETDPQARYAIKVIPIQSLIDNEKKRELVIREIGALKHLRGDHMVHLVDVMQNAHHLYLVMDYCDEGDLAMKLADKGRLSEEEGCSIVKQIADVFIAVDKQQITNKDHKMTIMHRDIKPANILFHKGKVKVADFGFVKIIDDDEDEDSAQCHTILGTQRYSPPQILKEEKYSAKCDVWSTGVLFYRVLFGQCPWDGNSDTDLYNNIHRHPLSFPKEIPVKQETKDLLSKMLQIEENDRLSWKEVYAHPALKDVKDV